MFIYIYITMFVADLIIYVIYICNIMLVMDLIIYVIYIYTYIT